MERTLGFLYDTKAEQFLFGKHWIGPDTLPHGEWVKVARFEKDSEDGQVADVYANALPATYYRIDVLEGKDSTGSTRHGYQVTFGTGTSKLAMNIAEGIAGGMLSFRPAELAAQA